MVDTHSNEERSVLVSKTQANRLASVGRANGWVCGGSEDDGNEKRCARSKF